MEQKKVYVLEYYDDGIDSASLDMDKMKNKLLMYYIEKVLPDLVKQETPENVAEVIGDDMKHWVERACIPDVGYIYTLELE